MIENSIKDGDWADTEPKNNTDRTASTIELVNKIEELNKWLDLKSEYIEKLEAENRKIKEQLEIARNRLLWVIAERISDGYADDGIAMKISQTLTQIEELDE